MTAARPSQINSCRTQAKSVAEDSTLRRSPELYAPSPKIAPLEIFIATIQFFDACIIQNRVAVV
jgi:hypothetical protein